MTSNCIDPIESGYIRAQTGSNQSGPVCLDSRFRIAYNICSRWCQLLLNAWYVGYCWYFWWLHWLWCPGKLSWCSRSALIVPWAFLVSCCWTWSTDRKESSSCNSFSLMKIHKKINEKINKLSSVFWTKIVNFAGM